MIPTEEDRKGSYQIHVFKMLLDKPKCCKIPTNQSCVNLFITNKPRSFWGSCTFEIQLSDFHKMTLIELKSTFAKQKPRVLNCHDYKFFNNTIFKDQLLNKLRNLNLEISNKDLKHFKETRLSVLNTIAPIAYMNISDTFRK